MGKIFEHLSKAHGHSLGNVQIDEVVVFNDRNRRINLENSATYIDRLECSSWFLEENGSGIKVTIYRYWYGEYIITDDEEEGWDTALGYKLYRDWEPVHGLTGQYGYKGAILHDSERISTRMIEYMLESQGVFTSAYVAYEVDDSIELEGWCLLEKEM